MECHGNCLNNSSKIVKSPQLSGFILWFCFVLSFIVLCFIGFISITLFFLPILLIPPILSIKLIAFITTLISHLNVINHIFLVRFILTLICFIFIHILIFTCLIFCLSLICLIFTHIRHEPIHICANKWSKATNSKTNLQIQLETVEFFTINTKASTFDRGIPLHCSD
jgi:hypothetical protein